MSEETKRRLLADALTTHPAIRAMGDDGQGLYGRLARSMTAPQLEATLSRLDNTRIH